MSTHAVRRAHEGERTIDEVGQHPFADAFVETREVEFGDADVGVKHALGMGQLHARDAKFRGCPLLDYRHRRRMRALVGGRTADDPPGRRRRWIAAVDLLRYDPHCPEGASVGEDLGAATQDMVGVAKPGRAAGIRLGNQGSQQSFAFDERDTG